MTQAPKDTRLALLDAACRLFAEHGFDAVSTRMIAEAAQVNLGGIHYHFGGKEQLYVAAFQHAAVSEPRICLEDVAREHPELAQTPQGQAEIIRIMARKVFTDFFVTHHNNWKKRLITREFCTPSSAQDLLAREVFKPTLEGDLVFLRRLRPELPEETLLIWAITLHAQLIFYLLALQPLAKMYGERLLAPEFITNVAREAAKALILLLGLPTEPLAAPEAPAPTDVPDIP